MATNGLAHVNPRSVFVMQVITLRNEVIREVEWLKTPAVSAGPYKSFGAKLLGDMEKTLVELNQLGAAVGKRLKPASFEGLRVHARNLLCEAMALRTVNFVRQSRLDGGMCAIADKLLAQLALITLDVPYLTTVAESEFLGVAARIIRLRYPALSIWDLPVLAHELGHSFGPLWHVRGDLEERPHQAFLKDQKLGSVPVMDEYFCDLLATFLLGPAYVYTCILTRFKPTMVDDSETHPADAKRAWWVLRGLELLGDMAGDESVKSRYKDIAKRMRKFWKSFAKQSQASEVSDTDGLEAEITSLFGKMRSALPAAAYINPSRAWGLKADYKGKILVTQNQLQLRDLLNAAWFARAEEPQEIATADAINAWALNVARGAL